MEAKPPILRLRGREFQPRGSRGVKLTRHARNRQRLYRLTAAEIGLILRHGEPLEPDGRGNPRVVGFSADLRWIVVVIAADNPELIVTLFERR